MHPPAQVPEDQQLNVRSIHHRRAVVLNPYCDLLWDYRGREAPEDFEWDADEEEEVGEDEGPVPYVMLCDAYEEEAIRVPGDPDQGINRKIWERITKHQHDRYHTLPEGEIADSDDSLPLLVLDFKRVFTVPTRLFYPALGDGAVERIAIVPDLFREAMIQRFVAFQGRVSLPDLD